MDEIQKNEARNYLTAGGLLLLGIVEAAVVLSMMNMESTGAVTSIMTSFLGGLVLLIIGILLLGLHKRDLAGITFLIFGITHILPIMGVIETIMFAQFVLLIWGIIMLFSKDRQKWVYTVLFILFGVNPIASLVLGSPMSTSCRYILDSLIAVIAIYFALAAGSERIALPGRNLVASDETTDFKQSGSSIGYALFAGVTLCYTFVYLNIPIFSTTGASAIQNAGLGFGFAMVLLGILLFAVGKMRFTPVMFTLLGAAEMIAAYSSGAMMYVLGLLILITGLMAMMRKESRILPGIMLVIYSVSYFISAVVSGAAAVPAVSIVLNLIPALIALYLAIATLSQRELPLF